MVLIADLMQYKLNDQKDFTQPQATQGTHSTYNIATQQKFTIHHAMMG